MTQILDPELFLPEPEHAIVKYTVIFVERRVDLIITGGANVFLPATLDEVRDDDALDTILGLSTDERAEFQEVLR